MKKLSVLLLCGSLALVGCQNPGQPTNQEVGTIFGAVAGGLLGNTVGKGSGRTAAVIGGSLLGSMLGSNIGSRYDAENRAKISNVLEHTSSNRSSSWVDPDGREFTVMPKPAVKTRGHLCRPFEMSMVIGGKLERATGTACRNSKGVWEIQS